MTDLEKMGQLIRRIRKKKKLTQGYVAIAAETTKATVIRVEKGVPANFTTVDAIAEAIGEDLHKILRHSKSDKPVEELYL